MAPRDSCSGTAWSRSGICRGTAIERMPSCTTPTFSKMPVMFCATQPAMLEICHASGSAVATVPTGTRPARQASIASSPVPTTMVAFIKASVTLHSVISRNWRWNAPVCWSMASRTKASSSVERANSLTVRMLV